VHENTIFDSYGTVQHRAYHAYASYTVHSVLITSHTEKTIQSKHIGSKEEIKLGNFLSEIS
jgi:hypothetical protein